MPFYNYLLYSRGQCFSLGNITLKLSTFKAVDCKTSKCENFEYLQRSQMKLWSAARLVSTGLHVEWRASRLRQNKQPQNQHRKRNPRLQTLQRVRSLLPKDRNFATLWLKNAVFSLSERVRLNCIFNQTFMFGS